MSSTFRAKSACDCRSLTWVRIEKDAAFKAVSEAFKDGRADNLDGVTIQYDDWWFNLRGSNTEPLVRLNLEANTRELLGEKFGKLRAILGDPAE